MLLRLFCALLACCFMLASAPLHFTSASAEGAPALILPAGIREIGEEAFAGTAASHIVLPDGAKSIGSRAFADCENLTMIEIPESVVEIAADAFAGSENVCILCAPGSTAAFCAELYGIAWQDNTQSSEILVEEITLDASELTLSPGESATLSATLLPENASLRDVNWSSSDPSVATVSGGVVQAVKPGVSVITATAADGGGASAACLLTVDAPEDIISFTGMNGGSSSINMYLHVKATAPSAGYFTAMGVRMWDEAGALIVDYEKAVSTSSRSSLTMWFDVFADSGYVFAPESACSCQMHVVYNGQTYYTDVVSVRTVAGFDVPTGLTREDIVENLENCSDTSVISTSKKSAMVTMADALLGEGYDPAFVSGVLANIYYEGTFGKFESSKYSSNEPAYLVYMDENYDYRNKYSNKLIYDGISLSELSAMLDELAAANFPGKFGLGSVQWTGSRTRTLVALYIQEAAGSDTIALEQVIAAEVQMIKNELAGSYKSIYSKWQTAYAQDSATDDAACSAGYRICVSYEVPANYRSVAITRGKKAIQIYKVMMGL